MGQATPTLSTQITVISNGGAGQPVVTSDTATLTGAGNLQPGGTVTFWLVGPAAGNVCPSTANRPDRADHGRGRSGHRYRHNR